MNPRLAGYQIAGILAGCCILALSIYPQVIDWTIDYTCVGGRKFTDKILLSTIWKGQMPIGLYSHRGHAGFPLLAGIGALLFVYKNGLITKNRFFIINTLLFNALFFLRTRGVTLAALCSVVLFYYQFTKQQREFQRKMVITLLISIITAYGVYKTALNTMPLFLRKTPDLFSKNWDSSRMELWRTGIRAIMYRPLIGWGYDGYAIAAPYFENGSEAPVHIIKCRAMKYNGITRRVCITPSNERIEQKFMSAKAHNIAIDIALSLGVPGLFVFITLSFFALRYSCKGEFKEMILVFQLFLVYGLTWFECSQYGHVYWWALSIVLGGCDKNAFTAAVAPSETLSSIKSSTA